MSVGDPTRIYSVLEVARELGISTHRLYRLIDGNGPEPEFEVTSYREGAGRRRFFWTLDGVDRWRAFFADQSAPQRHIREKTTPVDIFSDHKAVNVVGGYQVSWRMWFEVRGKMWWFSTPYGWFTSADNGTTWRDTGLQTRPPGLYRITARSATVHASDWMKKVWVGADQLKARLERVGE